METSSRSPGTSTRRRYFWCAIVPDEGSKLMLEEFKKFALKGNVVDLAIGVIIGAAFGRIVDSIVGDIFMPIIGAITGGLDFQLLCPAFLRGNGRFPRRGEKAGRRACMGQLRHRQHQLLDHRLCPVSGGETHQPAQAPGSAKADHGTVTTGSAAGGDPGHPGKNTAWPLRVRLYSIVIGGSWGTAAHAYLLGIGTFSNLQRDRTGDSSSRWI